MAPPVLLVVGPPASGKTSLLQRFLHDSCEDDPKPSIGMQTGMFFHLDPEDAIFAELRELLPSHGVTFELMEIGGREPVHREMPRGRYVCGLMLCYDCRDRTSFLRLKHVLCRHRMDRHMEISCSSVSAVGELAAVLCATKTDLGASAVTQEEVKAFAEANGLEAVKCSAHGGAGVRWAFQTLVLLALRAELARRSHDDAGLLSGREAERAFALPCGLDVCTTLSGLTSPPNLRRCEPRRGVPATERYVEVLDMDGQVLCEPRTLEQCLAMGLLHRAVHVWLCVPRTGALLLRRWSPEGAKHPGLWGPSCHTEIHCYGDGDGHAAEVSTQSAERALLEQLGLEASELGELQHCFSCQTSDGSCKELLDVYLAPLSKAGLPPLGLAPDEEVEWVFFAHVMSPDFARTGRLFHHNNVYRRALAQRMRDNAIREDVRNAFALDLDQEFQSPNLAAALCCEAPNAATQTGPRILVAS